MSVVIYKFLKKRETKVFPFQYFRIVPIELTTEGKVAFGEPSTEEARNWELTRGGGVIPRYGWTIRSLKKAAESLTTHMEAALPLAQEADDPSKEFKAFTLKRNVFMKLKAKYRTLYGLEDGESDGFPDIDNLDAEYSKLLESAEDDGEW